MSFLFNINVCRVCMQNEQSCDLWSNKDLLEKFEFSTRLEVTEEDNLPKAICSRCTARLKVAYTFIKTAHESENNLKLFLTKISTEFKEVTQGNKSIKKSMNEQNLTEDDLLSLMHDENHEDILTEVDVHEKRKQLLTLEKTTKICRTELEGETTKCPNEIIKSKENGFENCKKDETVYPLTKDILLIHANNNEIDNEYEGNSHFMEIPTQDDEEETEKEHYNEEVDDDNALEKNQTYTSINMLDVTEESEIHSQSTELAMEEEENRDYDTMVNSQDDTIQYQSIYVDESSVDDTNPKNDNDFYINNSNEDEEEETHENPHSSKIDVINEQKETGIKSFYKTEINVHRFYCNKCSRDFSTKTNLNRHMQSHEGNKPFSCTECKKSFTQKSTLKQHMYTHTGERPYVCEVCNRGFTQCKSLIFHMRRHTGEKPFHCEYCLITFRQKDALRIHILKHHVLIEHGADGSEIFTCIICQRKFETKAEFKTHMKVHTATAEVDNAVELLQAEHEWSTMKRSKNSNNFGSDLLMPIDSECINAAVVNVSASSAAEPSRAKKFQCRKCFKCFALKKSLLRHMRIHYVNNDDDLTECLDCELQFSSAEVYQEHISECHQYACSACPELVFKTIQDLKIHMFEHDLDHYHKVYLIFKMDLKVCRICGGVEELKNILDQGTEIIDKLLVCANISIYPGDLLPKLICEQCEKKLDLSYHLRKQSEATQKRLRWELNREQNEQIPSSQERKSTENLLNHSISNQSPYSKDNLEIMMIGENSVLNIGNCDQMKDIVHEPVKSNKQVSEIYNIEKEIIEYISCDTNGPQMLNRQTRNEEKGKLEHNVITEMSVNNDSTSNDNYENNETNEIPLPSEYCSIDLLSSSTGSTTSDYCNDFENDQAVVKFKDLNALTCNTCHEVFTKKKDYSLHIKQHGEERYQCIQCCKFFPTRFRLKRHEEIHIEIPTHKCSYCKRSYRVLYNLNRHIRSVHLFKNNLECKVCNVSFSRIDVLKRHMQLHSDEKNYRCLLCSQSFKTRDYLYAHSKTHHSENSAISKTYKRTKTENVNKNQCGHCGKLFKSPFAYKNHLLIHTNEKPYECESCNKKFRTIAALTTHQRIHDDYRPYQCELCLKSFKQTAHLKEHKLLHLDNVPQHICSICQAPFAKKGNLKVHMRIHTKEKPFKCADCSAEFSYMHLLQRHASKVHSRSIHKVYTLNDTDESIENDDSAKSNGAVESELYHYIDTVTDDDYDHDVADVVDLIEDNQEIYGSSPGLEIINDESAIEQHIFEDEYGTRESEPIVDYIQIHSLDSIRSDLADGIDDYENHITEQKVDLFVSEETKLTRSVYNVTKLE
ncbi:zinc finger protein 91-like [Calliphora vicina]|uniref:zinc finger protein 91-like n=1 Tax=Calliphora vicina TaxID=7373 RepID=UPI00325A4B3C